MSVIHCRIITPHGVYKEMDATIINIESEAGQQGILPNHMPLVTSLKIGRMTTASCPANGWRPPSKTRPTVCCPP